MGALGNARCKRYALVVENGLIKGVFVEQEHNGRTGTKEDTYAENVLSSL